MLHCTKKGPGRKANKSFKPAGSKLARKAKEKKVTIRG